MKLRAMVGCIVFFSTLSSWAGGSVGNGGDVVVCRQTDRSIISVELLDYFEGRVQRGIVPVLELSKTVDDNVNLLIGRLGHFDDLLKNKVKEHFSTFYSEANFAPNIDLVDIPDSNHLSFPKNCAVEQIAVQNEPKYPQDKRYLISKDLWDLLNNGEKAGLIFHELLYRIYAGSTSTPVRYANSLVAANLVKSLSMPDYFKFFSDVFMGATTSFDGFYVPTSVVRFTQLPNGSSQVYSYCGKPMRPMVKNISGIQVPMNEKSSYCVTYDDTTTTYGFAALAADVVGQIGIYSMHQNKQFGDFSLTVNNSSQKITSGHNVSINPESLEVATGFVMCKKLLLKTDAEVACEGATFSQTMLSAPSFGIDASYNRTDEKNVTYLLQLIDHKFTNFERSWKMAIGPRGEIRNFAVNVDFFSSGYPKSIASYSDRLKKHILPHPVRLLFNSNSISNGIARTLPVEGSIEYFSDDPNTALVEFEDAPGLLPKIVRGGNLHTSYFIRDEKIIPVRLAKTDANNNGALDDTTFFSAGLPKALISESPLSGDVLIDINGKLTTLEYGDKINLDSSGNVISVVH